jgi:hypothetical protein
MSQPKETIGTETTAIIKGIRETVRNTDKTFVTERNIIYIARNTFSSRAAVGITVFICNMTRILEKVVSSLAILAGDSGLSFTVGNKRRV